MFPYGPDNIFAATMWFVAVDTGVMLKRSLKKKKIFRIAHTEFAY